MGKDYILDIRVKNGPMLRAMRAAGFDSAAQLSRASGASQQAVGAYLNLQLVPITKTGEWRESVIKISGALNMLPEDLFPPQHVEQMLPSNRAELELDLSDVGRLLEAPGDPEQLMIEGEALADIHQRLDVLSERYRLVIDRRFGLGDEPPQTLDEIAAVLKVSRERVRQMEQKALRQLRMKARKPLAADGEALGFNIDQREPERF